MKNFEVLTEALAYIEQNLEEEFTQQDVANACYVSLSGLQKLFGDRLKNIWLYGSYARGDQTDESDIDVMALVDLSAGELARYRRQISDFSSNLDLKYGVLLAIKLQDRATFDFYGAASPFFQNVMREGVSLVS